MDLLEVKTFIEKGEREKAESLIRASETVSIRDCAFHLTLVELCEDLGVVEKIPSELNLALRDKPDDLSIIKKLAHFHLDSGDLDKSEKYFRKALLLDSKDKESCRELWHILAEKGKTEDLEILSDKIRENFPDSDLAKLTVKKETTDEVSRALQYEKPEEPQSPSLSETSLVRFVSLFSGREGLYARQWASSTGETGYTPIKEPFNYRVAKNHILGNYTVGIYQLRIDNTVKFIAFDVDITKKVLTKIMTDKKLWKGAIKQTHDVACKIMDILSSLEIPVYLESSGYKGRHCWIFLEKPLSAKIAKAFAGSVVNRLGLIPEGTGVEIFPKQDYVRSEGLGNLIKLPLGIHRKTGRKSQFIDPKTGKAFEDQLSFLDNIIKCPLEKIIESAGEGISYEPPPEDELTDGVSPEVVTLKSSAPSYNIDTDREFQYILLKCNVIKYLYDKIKTHHELTNDEIVVLSYSLGHLTEGPDTVNSLLKLCPGTGQKYFLKSRLRGNPVSCPKIRSKIPDITSKVECNCTFEHYPDMYPTPVLHTEDLKNPSFLPVSSVDSIQFQILVQEYLKTGKEFKQLQDRYRKLHKQLDEFFSLAGITSVQTSFGLLKRTETEGKINYLLEL